MIVRKFKLLFFLFFFVPIQYLSYNVYSNNLRDNFNYSLYFDGISPSFDMVSFSSDYLLYHNAVGAREPIYFLYSEIMSKIGFSYVASIVILNLFFIFSITFAIKSFNVNKIIFAMITFHLATSFYVFTLSGDIHRLKLGLSFFLLAIASTKKSRGVFSVLMLLSHFQTIILLPLLYSVIEIAKKYSIIFIGVGFFTFPYILGKFLHYFGQNSSLYVLVFYFLFVLVFYCLLFPCFFSGFKLRGQYLIFILISLLFAILVGMGRVNLFIFEASLFYFIYEISKRRTSLWVYVLCVYVFVFSIYDIYRIYTLYNDLMYMV